VLGVLVAGYAAYGSSLVGQKPETSPIKDISVTPQTEAVISTSTDWRNQFLTTGTNAITTKSSGAKKEPEEPETLTGQFGKKFFQQYMYLKENNLSEDPGAIKALVEQTTQNLVDAAPLARIYDVREIKISTSAGVAAERAYGNTIGSLLAAYVPRQDAGTIALQALEQEDQSRIKEVEVIASSYNTLLKEILAIPAPASLATYHVALVNALSAMQFSSQGMTKVFTDPIQSVGALSIYQKSVGQFRDALLDLRFIFTQDGVTFSTTDAAIIIFNMTD
jgi:hypothetical protein